MNYAPQVRAVNEKDQQMDETGFGKFLRKHGKEPADEGDFRTKPMVQIQRYLETFGFIHGTDIIDAPVLWTLQHIYKHDAWR